MAGTEFDMIKLFTCIIQYLPHYAFLMPILAFTEVQGWPCSEPVSSSIWILIQEAGMPSRYGWWCWPHVGRFFLAFRYSVEFGVYLCNDWIEGFYFCLASTSSHGRSTDVSRCGA